MNFPCFYAIMCIGSKTKEVPGYSGFAHFPQSWVHIVKWGESMKKTVMLLVFLLLSVCMFHSTSKAEEHKEYYIDISKTTPERAIRFLKNQSPSEDKLHFKVEAKNAVTAVKRFEKWFRQFRECDKNSYGLLPCPLTEINVQNVVSMEDGYYCIKNYNASDYAIMMDICEECLDYDDDDLTEKYLDLLADHYLSNVTIEGYVISNNVESWSSNSVPSSIQVPLSYKIKTFPFAEKEDFEDFFDSYQIIEDEEDFKKASDSVRAQLITNYFIGHAKWDKKSITSLSLLADDEEISGSCYDLARTLRKLLRFLSFDINTTLYYKNNHAVLQYSARNSDNEWEYWVSDIGNFRKHDRFFQWYESGAGLSKNDLKNMKPCYKFLKKNGLTEYEKCLLQDFFEETLEDLEDDLEDEFEDFLDDEYEDQHVTVVWDTVDRNISRMDYEPVVGSFIQWDPDHDGNENLSSDKLRTALKWIRIARNAPETIKTSMQELIPRAYELFKTLDIPEGLEIDEDIEWDEDDETDDENDDGTEDENDF